MNTYNQKVLLLILSALLLIKFVLQPWLQWIGTERQAYQQSLNREHRALHLLQQSSELERQLQNWQNMSEQLSEFFPPFEQVSDAQLFIQQQVQQYIRSNSAQLELYDWVTVLPLVEVDSMQALVRVRFTSLPANVATVHALFEQMPSVSVTNAQFTFQQALRPDANVSALYELSFVFRLGTKT